MKRKIPFFFLFMGALIGALLSLLLPKEVGVVLCVISIIWFFLFKFKMNMILTLFIFVIGFVLIESPSPLTMGEYFLVGNVVESSKNVVKLNHVKYYEGKRWIRGRNAYVFLNHFKNSGTPYPHEAFIALVKNEGRKIHAQDNFWIDFGTPVDKLYAQGRKISDFLYKEMKKYISSESETIASLFLGRKDVSYELRESYKNGGYAHIFSVSGMHVGMLALFSFMFFSELVPWNLGKYPLTFFVVLLYGLITGFSIPTVRAVVMFGFFAFFKLVDRPQNFLNVLGMVGLIEILADPSLVFDASFQLSYSGVASIGILFPVLPRFNPKWLSESLNLALAANIGVAPFLILNYGKIYLSSFIFNATIVPILVLILLEGAVIFSLSALLGFSFAEKVIGGGVYLFAKMMDEISIITEKIPLSILRVEPREVFFLISFLSVVSLFLWILLSSSLGNSNIHRKNSTDDLGF